MTILLIVCLIGLILCTIFWFRNNTVCKAHLEAVNITSKYAKKAIQNDLPWAIFYEEYELSYGNYDRDLLNLKYWTVNQFIDGWDDYLSFVYDELELGRNK